MSKQIRKIVNIPIKIMEFLYEFLSDIFFPKKCVNCGQIGRYLCEECFEKIEIFRTPTCYFCGKLLEIHGSFCPKCYRKHGKFLAGIVVVSTLKSQVVEKMVYGLKYQGIRTLSEPIAYLMAKKLIISNKPVFSAITAVPLHYKRANKRGYNQSELIAIKLAALLNLPYISTLERIKNTKSQIYLSQRERTSNITGSFTYINKEKFENKNILIIDDVATSGSTLMECAKMLKRGGAKKIFGVVFARNI